MTLRRYLGTALLAAGSLAAQNTGATIVIIVTGELARNLGDINGQKIG